MCEAYDVPCVVVEALKYSPDVDACCINNGASALDLAVATKSIKHCAALLRSRPQTQSAFARALRAYDWKLVQLFFSHGARLPIVDESNLSPQSAALLAELKARIHSCRRRAATILSARFRARLGVPRDVAMIIARKIWAQRRG